MKFIMYCEIPDKDKNQIKNYSNFIEKNTSIKINNIFINYDDTIDNVIENDVKEVKQETKKSVQVSKSKKYIPTEPIHKQRWQEYDNLSQMPTPTL